MQMLSRTANACLIFGLAWGIHGCRENPRATPQPEAEGAAPTPVADAASCEPDDARGDGPCDRVISFAWNGHKCDYVSGCVCKGRDCNRYKSLNGCTAAHAACVSD